MAALSAEPQGIRSGTVEISQERLSGQHEKRKSAAVIRAPVAADGPAVTALIAGCPPLDTNSAYCNLLQCTHFEGTCILAERDGAMVGWISGYRPPSAPEQIFVWQVAVAAAARGEGLALRMLDALIERPAVRDAETMIATVTEANQASWRLFEGFARRRGLSLARAMLFDREAHFRGAHDTEFQVTIGPLPGLSGAGPSGTSRKDIA